MDHLKVNFLGPIIKADIRFGDLTLFVGPQASGKSIILQLLKLIIDKASIRNTWIENNYKWGPTNDQVIEAFFGENTSSLFSKKTNIIFKGEKFAWSKLNTGRKSNQHEKLFYVPAQRVLSMSQGWPRAFSTFDIGDPYVIKQFSETLRQFLDKLLTERSDRIFPRYEKMGPFTNAFNDSIFHGANIVSDPGLKNRFLLRVGKTNLPFMTWSAGQKEFMPLLISFYYLIPKGRGSKAPFKWVVIEEPEMGLHPQAIQSIMQVFLDLISRGYKLIISTHSPVLLELAWAMKYVQEFNGSSKDIAELFGIDISPHFDKIFSSAIRKKYQTYFFDQKEEGVFIRDISTLDAANSDQAISNWGGLSSFSSRANEIVAKLVANEK